MSFRKFTVLALSTLTFLLVSHETSAIPVTDINKLPSITVDTLYPKQTAEDSQTSESVGFVRNMLLGTQALQSFIRPREERTYVTLFRLPWRVARSVSQSTYGMAKGFMDAFTHQFIETYSQMQRNVIPQASEALAVWSNPPKPNLETQWLEGGV